MTLFRLGWASVQCSRDQYVILDVMTPDGHGIHLRQPALLKHLFHLRGSPMEETPFFEKLAPSKDLEEKAENHSNEVEMLIHEKLWKGEEQKRRRRAKRT